MQRGERAEQDAERIGDEDRQGADPHRHRPGLRDQIDDGWRRALKRHAEIAVQGVPHVAAVLVEEGLVEAVLRGARLICVASGSSRSPEANGSPGTARINRNVISETAKRTKISPRSDR